MADLKTETGLRLHLFFVTMPSKKKVEAMFDSIVMGQIRNAGFKNVTHKSFSFGICRMYCGEKE